MEFLQEVAALFVDRADWFAGLLVEHIALSAIAIAIAGTLGLLLGILVAEHRRFAPFIIGICNVVYTIPSIALLGLLIPLNILALFYFTNFFCNALASLSCSGRSMRLFSIGLWLFLCCDLCVGLFQNPQLVPPAVSAFVSVGMWLFYLPAQVLIALSGANPSSGGFSHETK